MWGALFPRWANSGRGEDSFAGSTNCQLRRFCLGNVAEKALRFSQVLQRFFDGFGLCFESRNSGKRVAARKDFVGLGLGDIDHQNGYHADAGRLGPQVPVDD